LKLRLLLIEKAVNLFKTARHCDLHLIRFSTFTNCTPETASHPVPIESDTLSIRNGPEGWN
jgi:hypothetical protein